MVRADSLRQQQFARYFTLQQLIPSITPEKFAMSDYITARERAYIRRCGSEATDDAQAERLADLELTPIATALRALLEAAQDVMESRTATEDEKRLAERLLDFCGPSDDCWLIGEIVK